MRNSGRFTKRGGASAPPLSACSSLLKGGDFGVGFAAGQRGSKELLLPRGNDVGLQGAVGVGSPHNVHGLARR